MNAEATSALFARLGLTVFVRGWLSSNNVVFGDSDTTPATIVDTGYASHAEQTLALISTVCPHGVRRIVNTHLHSDHCGGNASLQRQWSCETWVPEPALAAVRSWDMADVHLTFDSVDQRCERFDASTPIRAGSTLRLGHSVWQIHAAPGHDPDAVMLFEPNEKVLISGDALWEQRIAIVFPELLGEDGFAPACRVLDLIDTLRPRLVIPGHGEPFFRVSEAIADSRQRLHMFMKHPERHRRYAARALLMFHMLEHRRRTSEALLAWMCATPMLRQHIAGTEESVRDWARDTIDRLVHDGILKQSNGYLSVD